MTLTSLFQHGTQKVAQQGEQAGHAAEQAGGHGGSGADHIIHHITDSNALDFFGYEIHLPHLELFGFDISITKHVVMMWIVAALLIVITKLSLKTGRMVQTGFGNFMETIIVFIRDEIVYVNFGKSGRPFVPFFLTVFFFILGCNLLGLIPPLSTATGNITVTATLAIISFIMILGSGIKYNGLGGWLKSIVPGSVPLWLYPVMIPVEIIGLLAKPFALAVRLFANMTAGHVVLLALMLLIVQFHNWFIAPAPIGMAIAIYCLEIFVAFLQAYIFTFLSAIFISAAVHPDH